MNKQYDNTNSGAAFQKDGYEGFSGTLNVEGKEYWVTVYNNEKEGKQYRKIKVKPKDDKSATSNTAQASTQQSTFGNTADDMNYDDEY